MLLMLCKALPVCLPVDTHHVVANSVATAGVQTQLNGTNVCAQHDAQFQLTIEADTMKPAHTMWRINKVPVRYRNSPAAELRWPADQLHRGPII